MTDEDAAGGPAFAGTGAASAVREHWEDLIGDMDATAAEFEEAGWETLRLHPGDVTAVTGDRWGFDVLVPDDEFERLREWVEAGAFDEHDVYRVESGIQFALVVLKDDDGERAVCCPLYYDDAAVEGLGELAERRGRVETHVRNLAEEYVTFTHDEPDLFFPDDGD
ncbi:DUF7529 family protein [Halosimplex pelagicum]|uniref:Uncharacterized protein n=1 Tax=Halosimplex pelagicum TaxID=869886 RepID=A0A7D5SWI6_9EURY|nr:hypothetical protein [Halosimplex pelagicum]QLH83187.1 hypothetical protein HZS54_16815 [Halosimplex pelagicum]